MRLAATHFYSFTVLSTKIPISRRMERNMPEFAKPTVHICFNASAAQSIKQALATIGCAERVIGFLDDLSFGPVFPAGSAPREEWVQEWLGYEWGEVAHAANQFWTEAASPGILPVAWVSRHDASEYSAFLEFIRRRADSPFRVIDATDIEFAWRGRQGTSVPRSLGILTPAKIVEARLLERQRMLNPNEIAFYVEEWRRLTRENAPLRVVDGPRLVSAPITFFDDAIVSCASDDWKKAALIIGETMCELIDNRVSDLLLWARVCALGEEGVLELRGDLSHMHGTFARRGRNAFAPA
ncbi:DUF3658 domain-containing protein [Rhodoblastus sp.]|uniref:DUF3658 domain-containing protein n=1 Tax=Rhodoblastus sp. TaxID=1962975 RepID=UPI0035B218D4